MKLSSPKTVILWDIDGTLLLTGGAGMEAFNRVFEDLFQENSIWQNVNPDGRTDDWIISQLFLARFNREPSPDELVQVRLAYNEAMRVALANAPKFRLMPFVRETLEHLHAVPNLHMGIATGNYRLAAQHKLKRGGIDSFFSFGGYGCDARERLTLTERARDRAHHYVGGKPDQLYLIGDTIYDIQCGKAIGAQTIGVCTGSTKAEALEEAGADWVLTDLSSLIPIIKH